MGWVLANFANVTWQAAETELQTKLHDNVIPSASSHIKQIY